MSNSTKLLQNYSKTTLGVLRETTPKLLFRMVFKLKKTTQFEVGECATPRNKRPSTRARNSHPRNGGTKNSNKSSDGLTEPPNKRAAQASISADGIRKNQPSTTNQKQTCENANQAQAPQWRAKKLDTPGSRTNTATPTASASNSPPRTITRENNANNTGHKQPPRK